MAAIEACRAALAIYWRLDAPAQVARMESRLQALTRGAPTLPAGLSAREAEVLGLVAAGLSNREIAARLFLSEHTVAHHLTSAYGKAGVDNRAAAVAFAVRHGLG